MSFFQIPDGLGHLGWDHGYDRSYLRRPWRSLEVGAFYIWVHTEPKPRMPVPLENTVLVNRALRVQERIL